MTKRKGLKKFISVILMTVLLITCIGNMPIFALSAIENEKYITSYNCEKGTTVTATLSEVIQKAKSTKEIKLEASTVDIYSEKTNNSDINTRTVFNENEWIEASPYDPKVAYIRTYWKDGSSNTRGTAFFISNDTVVTSAHCIYNASKGGWCDYADIFPAKNGSSNPYGQISSDTIHLLTSYLDSPTVETDYAIIELERAANVGYFGWNTSATVNQNIKITGYPSRLNSSTSGSSIIKQYYDTGTISSVKTASFRTANTNTNGGSSGGPTLNLNNQVIGIVHGHTKTNTHNIITRVTSHEAQWFSTFR